MDCRTKELLENRNRAGIRRVAKIEAAEKKRDISHEAMHNLGVFRFLFFGKKVKLEYFIATAELRSLEA